MKYRVASGVKYINLVIPEDVDAFTDDGSITGSFCFTLFILNLSHTAYLQTSLLQEWDLPAGLAQSALAGFASCSWAVTELCDFELGLGLPDVPHSLPYYY